MSLPPNAHIRCIPNYVQGWELKLIGKLKSSFNYSELILESFAPTNGIGFF